MLIDTQKIANFISDVQTLNNEYRNALDELPEFEQQELIPALEEMNHYNEELDAQIEEVKRLMELQSRCQQIGYEAAYPIVETIYDKETADLICTTEGRDTPILDKLADIIVQILKGILRLFAKVFVKISKGIYANLRKTFIKVIDRVVIELSDTPYLIEALKQSGYMLSPEQTKEIVNNLIEWSKFLEYKPKDLVYRLIDDEETDYFSDLTPPTDTDSEWFQQDPPKITLTSKNWPAGESVSAIAKEWTNETIKSLHQQVEQLTERSSAYYDWISDVTKIVQNDSKVQAYLRGENWSQMSEDARRRHQQRVDQIRQLVAYFQSWGQSALVFQQRFYSFEMQVNRNIYDNELHKDEKK